MKPEEPSYFLHGCIVLLVAWNISLSMHAISTNRSILDMDRVYFATTVCALNNTTETYADFKSCVSNDRDRRVQQLLDQ
jgi:hypothetical protein